MMTLDQAATKWVFESTSTLLNATIFTWSSRFRVVHAYRAFIAHLTECCEEIRPSPHEGRGFGSDRPFTTSFAPGEGPTTDLRSTFGRTIGKPRDISTNKRGEGALRLEEEGVWLFCGRRIRSLPSRSAHAPPHLTPARSHTGFNQLKPHGPTNSPPEITHGNKNPRNPRSRKIGYASKPPATKNKISPSRMILARPSSALARQALRVKYPHQTDTRSVVKPVK